MNEKLYQLLQKAELDFELRKRIWAAKDAKDPAVILSGAVTKAGIRMLTAANLNEISHSANKAEL